ncbi:hypothetical protein BaRGS_00012317 [Batillaria attramentaria]|uniref:Uncharacterized protein n=1 Tax=Batillaria attramentaria TaxID=370345 RepID=A0ABD0LAL9_9CAEN
MSGLWRNRSHGVPRSTGVSGQNGVDDFCSSKDSADCDNSNSNNMNGACGDHGQTSAGPTRISPRRGRGVLSLRGHLFPRSHQGSHNSGSTFPCVDALEQRPSSPSSGPSPGSNEQRSLAAPYDAAQSQETSDRFQQGYSGLHGHGPQKDSQGFVYSGVYMDPPGESQPTMCNAGPLEICRTSTPSTVTGPICKQGLPETHFSVSCETMPSTCLSLVSGNQPPMPNTGSAGNSKSPTSAHQLLPSPTLQKSSAANLTGLPSSTYSQSELSRNLRPICEQSLPETCSNRTDSVPTLNVSCDTDSAPQGPPDALDLAIETWQKELDMQDGCWASPLAAPFPWMLDGDGTQHPSLLGQPRLDRQGMLHSMNTLSLISFNWKGPVRPFPCHSYSRGQGARRFPTPRDGKGQKPWFSPSSGNASGQNPWFSPSSGNASGQKPWFSPSSGNAKGQEPLHNQTRSVYENEARQERQFHH